MRIRHISYILSGTPCKHISLNKCILHSTQSVRINENYFWNALRSNLRLNFSNSKLSSGSSMKSIVFIFLFIWWLGLDRFLLFLLAKTTFLPWAPTLFLLEVQVIVLCHLFQFQLLLFNSGNAGRRGSSFIVHSWGLIIRFESEKPNLPRTYKRNFQYSSYFKKINKDDDISEYKF